MDVIKHQLSKIHIPPTVNGVWRTGAFIGIIVLMILYFFMAVWYAQTYGQFRSTPSSIQRLLTIKRHDLGTSIDPLYPNQDSVCNQLLAKKGVYGQIQSNSTALVNWRPLTVRLTGYLGGINGPLDGVFDMTKGVQLALSQGARAFVLDIDYLEEKPCDPVVIFRDDSGYMRSLHTGSIKEACSALNEYSFTTNYDPVLVIVYLRRIPTSTSQQTSFFTGIASSLEPLATYHLGSTDQGNFHNCRSEANLFTSQITNYQKKFIVLCNYNTNLLPQTQNPKDNLDFWTNGRIYVDESGKSSALGSVTASVPQGQIAYAQVGYAQQLLNIGTSDQSNYLQTSSNTFKIAMGPVNGHFSATQLNTLLNTLGIQCVPIDVVNLSATPDHLSTIKAKKNPTSVTDLSNAQNTNDLLSFWIYSGWSKKRIIEGFTDVAPVPVAAKIPGFVIPPPTIPKRPPPSTNSNGGLVSIA